ncbi:MAG: DUF11 domain-containing protein [Sedimentisphaerales bacterium]|nr:DUF11 domain-containing protein [Sedimentisphaerales bacterium]
MKRLLSISNLLLVIILLSLAGCKIGRRSGRNIRPAERSYSTVAPEAGEAETVGMLALKPAPAPVEAALAEIEDDVVPSPTSAKVVQPVMMAGSENYVLSRIYPCRECGSVRLDKTMPKQVELNKALTYSIKVMNLTGSTLNGIVVSEELPASFALTGASPAAKQDGNNLVWEITSLGPRAVIEITVSGTASKMESLKYCTNVVTPVATTCGSIEVIQPRLKLTRVAPAGVLLCEPIRVKYVLTNTGTGAAREVKIVETLPEGIETADGKSELTIGAGTIMAGQAKEFSAELKAVDAGKYVSKATASSADGLQAESEAVTTVVDKPVLSITQNGPDKQYVGRAVTYEITVTNESDAPAKDAMIENDIPDGVKSMKATAGARLSGRKIVWPLGTLAPKASKTVQVSFTPTREGLLTNKVNAAAYCADAVSASAQTVLKAIPAVLLEVVDIDDPVEVGTRTTYVITVTNQGSAASTNVSIVCNLEDNVRYVSSSGSTIGTIEDGTLTFAPLASLTPKAKATWRVVVTALREGDTRFRATMNADELTRPVEETEATRIYE